MDSQPTYSQQHNICEDIDGLNESDETGALLVRVPYIQYEDDSQCHEPERQYSNTVHACYSYCMDRIVRFTADRPLKTTLAQLVIGFLLLIILVQLILKATSMYNSFWLLCYSLLFYLTYSVTFFI